MDGGSRIDDSILEPPHQHRLSWQHTLPTSSPLLYKEIHPNNNNYDNNKNDNNSNDNNNKIIIIIIRINIPTIII